MAKAESQEIWILLASLQTLWLTLANQTEATPTPFSVQRVLLPATRGQRLCYQYVPSEHIRTRAYRNAQKYGSFAQEASIQIQNSCR